MTIDSEATSLVKIDKSYMLASVNPNPCHIYIMLYTIPHSLPLHYYYFFLNWLLPPLWEVEAMVYFQVKTVHIWVKKTKTLNVCKNE